MDHKYPVDENGFPVRMNDKGERICVRPACFKQVKVHRINGFCSIDCRDRHAFETRISSLEELCVKLLALLSGERDLLRGRAIVLDELLEARRHELKDLGL